MLRPQQGAWHAQDQLLPDDIAALCGTSAALAEDVAMLKHCCVED
jgi:hypothetical protein